MWFIKIGTDLEYFPYLATESHPFVAPELFVTAGGLVYAGAGIGIYYHDGSWGERALLHAARRARLPGSPRLFVDLNVNYRFNDWDTLVGKDLEPTPSASAPPFASRCNGDAAMNDKELHRQKYQAQLDEWKADVAKLKARAAGAKADAQIELNKHLKELDRRMHEAGLKLSELAAASEEGWSSVKKNVETTWAALKAGVNAAQTKFKE